MQNNNKIAIVYDWLDKWGGVERVLLVLHEMFPQAPFFTSYVDEKEASWTKKIRIRPSFMQKFPRFVKKNRLLSFPFYPYAFESFDFSAFDLVISVTSSFAKGIVTKPETAHICYLLTPTRYFWLDTRSYFRTRLFKIFAKPFLTRYRQWDYIASQRPDFCLSISKTVKERVQKFYGRDSFLVYPPFDLSYWKKIKKEISNGEKNAPLMKNYPLPKKFFLVVSRFEPYKSVDFVVDAFNRIEQNLVVVGKGTQEKRLKKLANTNIVFLSNLSDKQLGFLYKKALALIMPQEEDFGYTSLEAQFMGTPVIAYKKGGAKETVLENKTGLFLKHQSPRELVRALEKFHILSYTLASQTKTVGEKQAARFSKEKFEKKFGDFVQSVLK